MLKSNQAEAKKWLQELLNLHRYVMKMTYPTKNFAQRRTVLGTFAAIYGVGYLSYMLMPLQVGALIESLSLNEAQAGSIATAELIALAVALFALAPKIAVFSKRKLALAGGLIVIVGHLLSATADSYTPLVLYRILTGLGAGLVLAAGNAVIAATTNPQRMFAIVFAIGQMQAAAMLIFLPELISLWAHSGIYGFLAVWTVLMLTLLKLLPEQSFTAVSEYNSNDLINLKIFLLPSVLAMILIGISDSSLWTFQERIAYGLGMDQETIGLVLGGALLSGMLGATFAAVIGTRVGRVIPIIGGTLWMAIAYLVITQTQSQSIYIAIELSYLFAYGFVIPYLFGLNGELDPSGGAMVAANGCNLVGISLGPICAGYLIVESGYPAVGKSISFLAILAMSMYLLVIKKHFSN